MLTVLDVLIEPNAAALVDGNSLVAALENIKLVLTEFFVSRCYKSLEHQLSTIYRQFMLMHYEERHHDESIPQFRALERAFKQSSEGQRADSSGKECLGLSAKECWRLHEYRRGFVIRSGGCASESSSS